MSQTTTSRVTDGEPDESIRLKPESKTTTQNGKKSEKDKKEKTDKKKEKRERREKEKEKEKGMKIAVSQPDTSLTGAEVLPLPNEEQHLDNSKEKKKKKKKNKDKADGEVDEAVTETVPANEGPMPEVPPLDLTTEEQSALAEIVRASEAAGNVQQSFPGTTLKRKHEFVNAAAGTTSEQLPEDRRPAYAVSTSEGIHGILPNAEASSSSAAPSLQIPLDASYMAQLATFPEPEGSEPSTKRRRGKAKHPFIPGGVGGKWLMSSELEKLGIPYKKGPFNTTEDRILKQALKDFGTIHNLDEEQMEKAIFRKKCKDTHSPSDVISSFWVGLSGKLPDRPVQAIYHRVRRMYHAGNYVGKWSPEEDELLLQLVKVQGFSWESISEKIGRMGTSCRDRYREIRKKDEQHSGKWTADEEAALREAIKVHVNHQGEISWLLVSEQVKTRNETQCRLKWATINKPDYQESHKKWMLEEELALVQHIYNSTAEEEDQVNWIEMAQHYFPGRSGPQLLKRFKGMRREIPDWASLEFSDLMERMLERVNQKIVNAPLRKHSQENGKATSEGYVVNSDEEIIG